MFSGFTSRWRTFDRQSWCRYARAFATSSATADRSLQDRQPLETPLLLPVIGREKIQLAKEPFGMYSNTKKRKLL
ncbi:hypothetical protein HanRHA438_Chr06g0273601 [Helianthus annuus]|nr:hypothetical protein HanIR_Chr06g0284291 [Helianthus annuus]KAJ0912377.1 hypothetical protein HanRHA438_Chr06g0273601 [Helianthus annuus]